jgi:peptidyl-prolyl cis-trans isomerase SurA
MKKLLCVIVFNAFVFITYSQSLFSYGPYTVNSTEFLNAYNKNKTATSDNSQALRDYLDLYIKFKLKVQAARDLHLDTLPSLKADLQNFRSQVKDNYLKDEKEMNRLLDEAFARSQKDIHSVYFFTPLSEKGDTASAYKIIKEVNKLLKSGKSTDDKILSVINKNSNAVQREDLGFITAFTLPYEFENIVYGLKPGQSSEPYRKGKGWYIFKNEGERNAVGKITIAQILLATPPGDNQQKETAKELADSIYKVLANGGNFASLAKQFSDDRNTFSNGGVMPEFGTAKYDAVFEDHAFSLQNDGEIAEPFETRFGYHIIKRIAASPIPDTKNDEAFMYNLKQEVLKDSRVNTAKQLFVTGILPKIGFKKIKVNEQDLWEVSDSSMMANKNITVNEVNENTILFTYNNHNETGVRDWIIYLRNSNKVLPGKMHESYKTLFSDFINASAVSNYASRLQDFNPTFKKQIEEFEEGNMLFEAMQREVWGKASSDTAGLAGFYKSHKEKYLWDRSAEAIIFSCANKTVADNNIARLKKGKRWKDIISQNSTQIQADSGRYELGQIPVVDRTNFTAGLITMPVINKNDGTAVFAKILTLYPGRQQRSFEDARGLVISDYQNYLEQKWVNQLEEKYPVKVNQKVLQALLQSAH